MLYLNSKKVELGSLDLLENISQVSPSLMNKSLHLLGFHTKIVVVTGMDASEIDKMGLIPEGVVVLPKPIPFNTIETILSQQSCEIAAIGF